MSALRQLDLFRIDERDLTSADYPRSREEADLLDLELDDEDPRRCPCCGFPAFLDVVEVWRDDRAFAVDACCEANRDEWIAELEQADRRAVVAWFESRTGIKARQVFIDERDGGIRLDFGLEIATDLARKDVQAFVREHHRHHRKPPAGDKFRLGVRNGDELVAVAIVGRPVARRLDAGDVLEVNRVAVNGDLPRALTWNACSILYGAAAREAKRRGARRIVTYLLETEDGTSLRAAGWTLTATTRGGSWDRQARRRADSGPTCRKTRWERAL